ncbi:mitogen-activated protein kinase kinase kinase 4 [Exaiptasia diaphana]|uniref:Protein kinase domain-containing protein n=1 Tax=Exaiptasia diaphana TaxID=2652724 RepID=A0A913WXJ5_EXADI|nr:mitogen-activated protein kinase kinase kinase 4 [Exaiptasia diaphana]
MAEDGDRSFEELNRTPLSPIVGTPCDELDAADLFEGYVNPDLRVSFDEDNEIVYLSPGNEFDSESSEQEFEDIYTQELGVTPPRNARRNKEKSKTSRKVQGLSVKMPEVRAEVEKQKKRDRDRGRETSQSQLRTERAYMRQYKRNSLGNAFSQDVDLSKSLNLPTVKIESRRFMSLKCTRPDKGRLKRSESDPKHLVQTTGELSNHRQEFLRTFSLLIKIGAHARQHKDNQFALSELERQTSEEHKKWQVKLCLALWLELRAWHNGRTMEEQDRFLVEERAHIDEVLDRIINFNLNKVISSGDDNISPSVKESSNSCCTAKSHDGIVPDSTQVCNSQERNTANNSDGKQRKEPSASDPQTPSRQSSDAKTKRKKLKLILKKHPVEDDKENKAQNVPGTSSQIINVQNLQTENLESLTPENESTPIKTRAQNTNPRNLVHELESTVHCIEALLEDVEAVEHLYSTQRALGEANPKYFSDSFNRNHDGLVLWMNLIKEMLHKLTLVARYIGIEQGFSKDIWQDWYDAGMGMLGYAYPEGDSLTGSTSEDDNCSSGSNDEQEVGNQSPKPPQDHFSPKQPMRSTSQLSQFSWSSTSRYRPFVDRNIKKFGLIKLGKRIGDILDVTLLKVRRVLVPEGPELRHDHLVETLQDWNESISYLEDILYLDVAAEHRPRTQSSPLLRDLEQTSTVINWQHVFKQLGLPSFRVLYLFLIRIPLDVSHECIRLRLEHRPKGEPSSLSINQLLRECKEVIVAGVLVKDYYLFMVEGIILPDDSDHEKLENDIEEFEQDLQNTLKVYFEYLHNMIHMLQRLPQASKGLKNRLEEEWVFVKHKYQHIRGGAVAGGTRFCVMAAGLLESTGDFLESGLDQCCSDLHDNTDHSEDVRRKIVEACRSIKLLFKEGRERASKALGFTKKLKIDLANAAKFKIDVALPEFLSMLEKTEHVQVVVTHTTGLLMFVPKQLLNKKSQIVDLLNACCGLKKGKKDLVDGYLIVMPSAKVETPMWTGKKIDITLTVDTRISLADVQVDGLILVVYKSLQLEEQRSVFLQSFNIIVTVVKEKTSSHQAISDSLDHLQDAVLSLGNKIISAIERANENLDVEMFETDESEKAKVSQNTVETMYSCFNFGFEYLKEVARLVSGTARKTLAKDMLSFARKWISFVMEKCERGRGTRPRWATQGLDFLTIAIDGKIISEMAETDFQLLKKQINDCISHVVGSANGGPSSSAYRPHSPAVMNSSPVLGKSSCVTSGGLLRPLSWPANKGKPDDSEHIVPHRTLSDPYRQTQFYSLAEDVQGEEAVSPDGVVEQPKPIPQHKDSLDYSTAPKMERVRHALKKLEHQRNEYLVERHVIGKVSSRKRDITSELANISNRRVPFKWQRGMKIGEGQFGKVFACVNLDTGEMMAMKQIKFHPNDHGEIKELADEIKNFEGMQHESLVKYYGVELHRDEMLIFMEFCADGTISDVAKLGLPESMMRTYTMQILVAVNVLHERGIIHRDVKGANIFLSSNGLLKLGDFGSSIKLKNQSQTMHGEVMNIRGTVAYMAPEVITMDKGAGYGRAADIWSIGCVVVEMAAGKPPWHDCDNNWQIMFRVGDGATPAIPETLSEEGQDFLQQCFLHDPHDRPTASELMDHAFIKCC